VVTQPDKPAGRKRKLTATPVGKWATDAGLPVIKTDNANGADVIERVWEQSADAGVVIAFGQKLGPGLLTAMGAVSMNLHASLLPLYRGAAPINWAMIEGQSETGVSVISLAHRMDAGLVYGQMATPIDPQETAGELHDRLAQLGPELILHVLDEHAADRLEGKEQDESLASKAPKLNKHMGTVDFASPAPGSESAPANKNTPEKIGAGGTGADALRCRIHGLTPWPGVRVRWVRVGDGVENASELLIRRVASALDRQASMKAASEAVRGCAPGTMIDGEHVAVSDGAIRLLEVQKPGGKAMPIKQFNKGKGLNAGDRLLVWQV
jgi:methionyl-tRNA formyltransferase